MNDMSNKPLTFSDVVRRHVAPEALSGPFGPRKRIRVPLTPEGRFKDSCRSHAGIYKRRGKLIPEPCAICGDERAQMHHSNYNRPLEVEWLCRPCHIKLHRLIEAKYLPRAFDQALEEMRQIFALVKRTEAA